MATNAVGQRAIGGSSAWRVVWTLALTEAVSWGVLFYAFSVFLTPMRRDLGWSPAALTGAYSLALLVSGFAAPFVGRWLDRHGPRALMTAGSVLGSLLVLAWSRVDDLPAYYLAWAGIGLAMAATLYEPAFATIAARFDADRPRAMLVVTVAAGFASTIFLPLSSWLVEAAGWRSALALLAAMLAALTILPHALLPAGVPPSAANRRSSVSETTRKDVAAAPRDGVALADVLRQAPFWWLTAAFCLETFSAVAVGVMLVAYLIDRGEGAGFAAAATGLIGAAQVGSRVLATLAGSRVSLPVLTGAVFALQAVALAVLMVWSSPGGVISAVVLLGAGRGAVTLMRPALVTDFFGVAHFGAISGFQALFLTLARAVAPVAAGAGYALFGGYEAVLWGFAGISLAAAGAMVGVRPAPIRRAWTADE